MKMQKEIRNKYINKRRKIEEDGENRFAKTERKI
jgi:hypothetical protein